MKNSTNCVQLLRMAMAVFFIALAPVLDAHAMGKGNSRNGGTAVNKGGNTNNGGGNNTGLINNGGTRNGGTRNDGPATGAPIDGGASLLLAGGVAFAIRRVRQARKKAKGL